MEMHWEKSFFPFRWFWFPNTHHPEKNTTYFCSWVTCPRPLMPFHFGDTLSFLCLFISREEQVVLIIPFQLLAIVR